MMKALSVIGKLVAISCIVLCTNSCHTFLLQGVKNKLMANEWMLTPFPKAGEKFITWKFNESGMEFYVDRRLVFWDDPEISEIEWVLRKGVSTHFLYFPDLPSQKGYYFDADNNKQEIFLQNYVNPPQYFRWQIITINKEELFISHEDDEGRKGGFQREFIKYDKGCEIIENQLKKGTTEFPVDMRRCP